MKVLILNLWHAKCKNELEEYLKDKIKEYDVFCFQEVKDDAVELCKQLFTNHHEITSTKFNDDYCNFVSSIFIKDKYEVINHDVIKNNDNEVGILQYVNIKDNDNLYHIINVHGVTRKGDDKLDYEARIRQSECMIDYLKDLEGTKIIAGDFNILRKADSIQIFSKNGYQDLINERNIITTRNSLCFGRFDKILLDSDYVFVDNDTNVKEFTLDNCLISDHLPLRIEV